jgi:hypothetical protein
VERFGKLHRVPGHIVELEGVPRYLADRFVGLETEFFEGDVDPFIDELAFVNRHFDGSLESERPDPVVGFGESRLGGEEGAENEGETDASE